LFLASDAILALNRFGKPFRAGRALNLATYFAGQWLIALSVALGL
ncbi:MAG: YhhN family, partial [Proteobacteria bacterium]|nr:YhhN family [Pseudomonadota bacterium]